MPEFLMERYERLKEFLRACPVEVKFSEPMARHTSLGMGGPADAAVFPDEDAVKALIPFLRDEGIPYTVIGKGTNVLVRDEGIRGAVIFTDNLGGLVFDACRDIPCGDRRTGEALLVAGGGCALRQIMSVSLRRGLSGIEGLVAIPGSVGGAVAGNAGAFGCEIKDVIQSLRLLMPGGEVRDLARKEMSFGSRVP